MMYALAILGLVALFWLHGRQPVRRKRRLHHRATLRDVERYLSDKR